MAHPDPRIYGNVSVHDTDLRLDITRDFKSQINIIWEHGGPMSRYKQVVETLRQKVLGQIKADQPVTDRNVELATMQIDDRIQNHLPIRFIQKNMAELLLYLAVYQREKFEHLTTRVVVLPPELEALHELQRTLGMRDD